MYNNYYKITIKFSILQMYKKYKKKETVGLEDW